MKLLLFNWKQLTQEQKTDLSFAISTFCIFLTLAFGLYSLSIAFAAPPLLYFAIIIFFIGLYLVWRFLKGAKQVTGGSPVLALAPTPKLLTPEKVIEKEIGLEAYSE